mmetsp:Transcript_8506/g.9034  ORF Transcript_8506/g.9034 Transcript_8506/m.9034 type:complete len:210 (-) Transcript_8506:788-1417(-)
MDNHYITYYSMVIINYLMYLMHNKMNSYQILIHLPTFLSYHQMHHNILYNILSYILLHHTYHTFLNLLLVLQFQVILDVLMFVDILYLVFDMIHHVKFVHLVLHEYHHMVIYNNYFQLYLVIMVVQLQLLHQILLKMVSNIPMMDINHYDKLLIYYLMYILLFDLIFFYVHLIVHVFHTNILYHLMYLLILVVQLLMIVLLVTYLYLNI